MIIAILQLIDDSRDRPGCLGGDANSWLTNTTGRRSTFPTGPACQLGIKVYGRSNEVDMGLHMLGKVV